MAVIYGLQQKRITIKFRQPRQKTYDVCKAAAEWISYRIKIKEQNLVQLRSAEKVCVINAMHISKINTSTNKCTY
jgi:hypothetical protein